MQHIAEGMSGSPSLQLFEQHSVTHIVPPSLNNTIQ